MYRKFGKRFLDLLITIPLLIFLSPALLIVAVLVRWKLGSPVFFRHKRPGLHGTLFVLLKFRSMRVDFDANGKFLPDEKRLVPFGNFLRKTSIDELPELINVWRGEMSLVGPRPLLIQYLERYTSTQGRRHDVKPGITGWAQVNGRNAITWQQKFDLDLWYVDHFSLWLDLKILALTLARVLKSQGIQQPGHATAEEFMGGDS